MYDSASSTVQQHPQSQSPAHVAAPSRQPPRAQQPKQTTHVVGIPSVSISPNDGNLVVGSAQSSSSRSWTALKVLGDGSFGTVWLCDWHGTLSPNTAAPAMQCGAGARPEWAGKRLVAVKRMKKKWEGGWEECQNLKELQSLRAIPFHPNIIPLYDFFMLPASKELYFVFESMEGNLYHLIKARKGRPLAGGLVASIFLQITAGLEHIHASGYFHRDMKPENVLVTTTGLHDYKSVSPVAPPNAPPEKDVVSIIKLADFGLARETNSSPPYTEYVSTRWYRAPEVLLLSRIYSNPVDMWALGTIMAELVNLRPLFPGANHIDQLDKICEVLGDPSDAYPSPEAPGRHSGGGPWPEGLKMAKQVGFQFPKVQPQRFFDLFDASVPPSLVHLIKGLLVFDPRIRLTSEQCLRHPYLAETIPRNSIPLPASIYPPPPPRTGLLRPAYQTSSSSTIDVRMHNGSGIQEEPRGDYTMRDAQEDEFMDVSPMPNPVIIVEQPQPQQPQKSKLLGSFGMKKHSKWNMFGGDKANGTSLPPVQEVPSGIKNGQSLTSEENLADTKKMNKKEAEKLQREAEKQRRALAEKMHREQARAVMQKRNQIQKAAEEVEWIGGNQIRKAATGPIRQGPHGGGVSPGTVNAASGRFASDGGGASATLWREESNGSERSWRSDRQSKSRRRESSQDHSFDQPRQSYSTVDSDPGPSRLRARPSAYGINRMTSASSLRTSFDDFPQSARSSNSFSINSDVTSARSSNSFSLDGQLAQDFRARANVDAGTPPPGALHSNQWMQVPPRSEQMRGTAQSTFIDLPRSHQGKAGYAAFDLGVTIPSTAGHINKADINPVFQVVSAQHDGLWKVDPDSLCKPSTLPPPHPPPEMADSPTSLPPFSELDAVAGNGGYEYPPLSPMAFSEPDDP